MLQRPPVRYALIALVISLAWLIIEHLAGWNTTRHDIGQYTRMLPMVLSWVLIFVTVNQTRSSAATFTFKEGIRSGLQMAFIFCAGFTLIIALYEKFINPEFFDTLKVFMLDQLQASHASQPEIDEAVKNMEMSFNGTAVSYFLLFVVSFGWGLILSAIAALVYRKK